MSHDPYCENQTNGAPCVCAYLGDEMSYQLDNAREAEATGN